MGKLLIIKKDNKIISAFHNGSKISDFRVSGNNAGVLFGDIFVGFVTNIVKNINAAFVELLPGINGYLDLNDNKEIIYLSAKKNDRLCVGDKILVQVSKEPIKTKPVSLTTKITLSGKYVVFFGSDSGKINISGKITDENEIMRLKFIAEELSLSFGYSGIIRTNAEHAGSDDIKNEFEQMVSLYEEILKKGSYGVKNQRLMLGLPAHLSIIRDLNEDYIEEIITDDNNIYNEIEDYLSVFQKNDLSKLKFYKDDYSLNDLYRIDTYLDNALNKNVWLKSGAYLVIEYTEAMTVIDVNSGKAIKGKADFESNALKVNLEAAEEILYQLRLRNISGMILIDFISMKNKDNKEVLFNTLKRNAELESTKTEVIDITKLGLIEMTRKRTSKPLYESMRG